jgi:hypothetical protein
MLEEIHRLTVENNRMLHKMRRSAMIGRIFTLLFYAALLLAPIWFYMTYLNTTVQNALAAYDRMQGTGQQAENQFQALEVAFKQFQEKFQSFTSTSTPTNQ